MQPCTADAADPDLVVRMGDVELCRVPAGLLPDAPDPAESYTLQCLKTADASQP